MSSTSFYTNAALATALGTVAVTLTLIGVPFICHEIQNAWLELDSEMAEFRELSNLAWKDIMQTGRAPSRLVEAKPKRHLHEDFLVHECGCALETKCPPGLPGPPGPKGSRGLPGLSGDNGIPGRNAPSERVVPFSQACLYCPQGIPGAEGARGVAGHRGMQGAKGRRGMDGLNASPGFPGDMGRMGIPGKDGRLGRSGVAGQQGFAEIGVQGVKGDPGPQGDLGAVGPPGAYGWSTIGAIGLNGAVGIIGFPGQPGTRGTWGKQGRPGPDQRYCPCTHGGQATYESVTVVPVPIAFPATIDGDSYAPTLQQPTYTSSPEKPSSQIPPVQPPAPEQPEPYVPTAQVPEAQSPGAELPMPTLPENHQPPPQPPLQIPASEVPAPQPTLKLPAPKIPTPRLPAPEVPTPVHPSPQLPSSQLSVPNERVPQPLPQLPAPQGPTFELPAPQLPAPEFPTPQVPTPDFSGPQLPASLLPPPDHPPPVIQLPVPHEPEPSPQLPAPQGPIFELPAAQLPTPDPSPRLPAPEHPVPRLPVPELQVPIESVPRPVPRLSVPQGPIFELPAAQLPTPDPSPRPPAPEHPVPRLPIPELQVPIEPVPRPVPQLPAPQGPIFELPAAQLPTPDPSPRLPAPEHPVPRLPIPELQVPIEPVPRPVPQLPAPIPHVPESYEPNWQLPGYTGPVVPDGGLFGPPSNSSPVPNIPAPLPNYGPSSSNIAGPNPAVSSIPAPIPVIPEVAPLIEEQHFFLPKSPDIPAPNILPEFPLPDINIPEFVPATDPQLSSIALPQPIQTQPLASPVPRDFSSPGSEFFEPAEFLEHPVPLPIAGLTEPNSFHPRGQDIQFVVPEQPLNAASPLIPPEFLQQPNPSHSPAFLPPDDFLDVTNIDPGLPIELERPLPDISPLPGTEQFQLPQAQLIDVPEPQLAPRDIFPRSETDASPLLSLSLPTRTSNSFSNPGPPVRLGLPIPDIPRVQFFQYPTNHFFFPFSAFQPRPLTQAHATQRALVLPTGLEWIDVKPEHVQAIPDQKIVQPQIDQSLNNQVIKQNTPLTGDELDNEQTIELVEKGRIDDLPQDLQLTTSDEKGELFSKPSLPVPIVQ